MSKKPRRWHPGSGFRCVRDGGTTAIWMRLEPDQSVTVVVRLQNWGVPYDGVWTANTPRGSGFLYSIMDKPHRVRWAWEAGSTGSIPVSWEPVTGPVRRAPKSRAYYRKGFGKTVHTRWLRLPACDPWGYGIKESLPRKFR